jgi:hypothetical protein
MARRPAEYAPALQAVEQPVLGADEKLPPFVAAHLDDSVRTRRTSHHDCLIRSCKFEALAAFAAGTLPYKLD